jgi:hypothetical protein
MFLEYGVSDDGALIFIEQVPRGRTALHCPYCGGLLLARKGKIKVPHFAHAGETCAAAARNPEAISLPLFDKFNMNVPGKVVADLRSFAIDGDVTQPMIKHELVKYNDWRYRGGYDLTKKGKLILGQLSLNLFCGLQEPLLIERHTELLQRAVEGYACRVDRSAAQERLPAIATRMAELESFIGDGGSIFYRSPIQSMMMNDVHNEQHRLRVEQSRLRGVLATPEYATAIIDLRLYRAQWQRLLRCTLYLLTINDGKFYKIGVTNRPITDRIPEIQADLAPHFGATRIGVMGLWNHRGNVEMYFKYRYRGNQKPIGVLTEYFDFPLDKVKSVLRDLRRMPTKQLSQLEKDILAGREIEMEKCS